MLNFQEWEEKTRKALVFSHNKLTDLGFKTLELCFENIKIIDHFDPLGDLYQFDYECQYQIAGNRYARMDYTAFMYFLFRLYLCKYESFEFVEEYDIFVQRLIKYYAVMELGLPHENVNEVLRNRLYFYEKTFHDNKDDFVIRSTDKLIIYLESDFSGMPISDDRHALEELYLETKVKQHIPFLMDKMIDAYEHINKQFEIEKPKEIPTPSTYVAENKQENKYEQKEHTNKLTSVLASLLWSILGLLGIYLVYGIAVLAFSLVLVILSYIPIVSILVEWLFRVREDTPVMFAMCFGTAIACIALTEIAKRIIKNEKTRKRSLMLTGIFLTALNVMFLIINLISRTAILANILLAIAGIVLFYKNKIE
ncbi:MAG: hypothetical protein J6D19_03285 [Clostridia bacterium]|nr:hypothetical protein [Clostridia bacterium]